MIVVHREKIGLAVVSRGEKGREQQLGLQLRIADRVQQSSSEEKRRQLSPVSEKVTPSSVQLHRLN